MPYNAILSSLLAELEAVGSSVTIQWDKAQEWPVDALNRLLKVKVLTPAKTAQSIECKACEHRCYKEITWQAYEDRDRAFIICEEPDMQTLMGRMLVPVEQLQQWKISLEQLARVIAGLLGFDSNIKHKAGQENIQLGMLKGSKGRRSVTLNSKMLSLEVNGYEMPLRELLYFENDELLIDRARVDDCLNRSSSKEGKQYSPSTDKREARMLKTQAMYQDWRDEYQKQMKKHPTKGDVWISNQIAKMSIAQGRGSETIRKNMK